MKVFVGWAYEAGWVEEYAIPLIESYGVDVLTGKELQGQGITDGVKANIKEADGAVFFTTRRLQDVNGTWKTSDWVVDEIKHASSLQKERILEVREEGVEWPNKINDARQYIPLKAGEERIGGLVKLGQTVSRWRGLNFKLKLLPEEFIKSVWPRVGRNDYQCSYSIRQRGKTIYGPKDAAIEQEDNGLFIYAHDLPDSLFILPDAFIQVDVNIGGDKWRRSGIPLSSLEITLQKL